MSAPAPTTLLVGPFVYKITIDRQPMDEYNREHDSDYCGLALHNVLEILVDDRRAPAKQKETLFHELVHCVLNTYDLHDKEADEHFVEVFSVAMLDTIQRNPDVMKHLLEPYRCG